MHTFKFEQRFWVLDHLVIPCEQVYLVLLILHSVRVHMVIINSRKKARLPSIVLEVIFYNELIL